MQIIRDLLTLRAARSQLSGRVALVPTMGALHEGHRTLVVEAARLAERRIVSIFVNPTQFGPGEDLSRYPRQEAADAAMLAAEGVDILWAPPVEVVYPAGFATSVHVGGITDALEGAARPGHFDGVATVVAKLFGQATPDVALFGEKDYQQLAVIRRMVADLDIAVDIVGVPTVRDADGLALSSRNAYLTRSERTAALALPRALAAAAAAIRRGDPVPATLEAASATLHSAGFSRIDYVALRDASTLAAMTRLDAPARLLAAAVVGTTRLIDNIAVDPE